RHTRSDRDWSSDVCSSDLPPGEWMAVQATLLAMAGQPARLCGAVANRACVDAAAVSGLDVTGLVSTLRGPATILTIEGPWIAQEIGRASCRERVSMAVGDR